jgi:IS30 family transposase
MLVGLPGSHTADVVADALAEAIATLPEQLRRSITWDQGKEMAEHARFSVATGVPVYFCDPHSPWQRGSNEKTNGLLRQYFPRSTDFRALTQSDLDNVAAELRRANHHDPVMTSHLAMNEPGRIAKIRTAKQEDNQ